MTNIVTIVGRPNVGKSTLFNRIIGKQQAIVDDIPGVTRDRSYGDAEWCGILFTLIDTGGYTDTSTSGNIAKKTNEQVGVAIEEANVIIFVLDCKHGLSAEDILLAEMLRKKNKPILVVANKADNQKLALQANNFYEIGINGPVYEVSAAHGSGTGDLLDAVIDHLPKEKVDDSESHLPKIALIGRSNVGKSTFVNALLGYERSIVDDKPNTTRVPVNSYYRLYNKELILVDTAGIMKKKQVKAKSLELFALIRSIRAIEGSEVCLMLVNAQEGITTQDKSILSLAQRRKKGIVLLVNKWDLLSEEVRKDVAKYKRSLVQQVPYLEHVPMIFTSGLNKKGIFQSIEKALEVYENRRRQIPTVTLNKILQKALIQHQPPTIQGRVIKINYATQLTGKSPLFALFCNFPKLVPANYKRFLEKQIRLFTSLEGAPVTLVFKKK